MAPVGPSLQLARHQRGLLLAPSGDWLGCVATGCDATRRLIIEGVRNLSQRRGARLLNLTDDRQTLAAWLSARCTNGLRRHLAPLSQLRSPELYTARLGCCQCQTSCAC
jgi:hypothetical protein